MTATVNLLYSIIGSLGLSTNGFAIFILLRLKNRFNSPNILILNQCIIDCMASLFSICQFVDVSLGDSLWKSKIKAWLYCCLWFNHYIFWSCIFASTANLAVLTMDRYCSVIYPLKYSAKKNNKWIKVALMLFPWICGPLAVSYWIMVHRVGDRECIVEWSNINAQRASGVFTFLYMEIAPVTLMAFVYYKIFQSLKSRVGESSAIGNANSAARRLNVIKTMALVSIIYAICWTPNQIVFFYYLLGGDLDLDGIMYYGTIALSLLNSVVNPIIYTFKYKDFQEGLRKTLSCLFNRS
ncbi:galanin receptor 2b-like [Antedon mediterranea]|uniref:galanin receptor 2b-like n=1 Tax=Antedon mediterranea TaxID=105859 RepID=UPI003AF8CE6C